MNPLDPLPKPNQPQFHCITSKEAKIYFTGEYTEVRVDIEEYEQPITTGDYIRHMDFEGALEVKDTQDIRNVYGKITHLALLVEPVPDIVPVTIENRVGDLEVKVDRMINILDRLVALMEDKK